MKSWLVFCLVAALLAGCTPPPVVPETPVMVEELPVTLIPLTGPAASMRAEISGLAWAGDQLVLLAQYPQRFQGGEDGAVFVLPRQEILDWLDGKITSKLEPRPAAVEAPGLYAAVPGFEGFEAIVVDDSGTAFVTIEARSGGKMQAYVVRGSWDAAGPVLHLDASTLTEVPMPVNLDNASYESALLTGGQLLLLYEDNGVNVNPEAQAAVLDTNLKTLPGLSLPAVEYRLTDASTVDDQGRFWAVNYFFTGDKAKLKPAEDALTAEFGEGASHAQSESVERLVEFKITSEGIVFSGRAPLWLELETPIERNWEGLVRLEGRGFLLATDTFPDTLLGFVPGP